MPGSSSPHTNCSLAEGEVAAIRAEARDRGVTMSQVVDEAVREFLRDEGRLSAGLTRPSLKGRVSRQCGYVLSAETRGLLRQAKEVHGFAQQDVIREAISPIVRRRARR